MSYPFFLRWRWHPAAHRLVVDHVDYTDDLRRHRTIRVSQAVYIVIRLVTNVDRTLRSRSFNSVQIHTRLNRRCAIRYQQNSHVLDDHSRSHTRCSLSYEHASKERKKKKRKKKNEHTLVLAVTDIHVLIYTHTQYSFFLFSKSPFSTRLKNDFYIHLLFSPAIFYSIIPDCRWYFIKYPWICDRDNGKIVFPSIDIFSSVYNQETRYRVWRSNEKYGVIIMIIFQYKGFGNFLR